MKNEKHYLRYLDTNPDYSKLKDPEKSAYKFRDELIQIQKKRLDDPLCRKTILEKTHNIMSKYAVKMDDIKFDLAMAVEVIKVYHATLLDVYQEYPSLQENIEFLDCFDKTDAFISIIDNKYNI